MLELQGGLESVKVVMTYHKTIDTVLVTVCLSHPSFVDI